MIFRWAQGSHNVFIHPTMDCTLDGAIPVGFASGTEYTFVEADGSPDGTDMFFSCDIGDGAHCRAGQFLTVKVFSDGEAEPEITNSDPVEEAEPEIPAEDPPAEEVEESEAPVAAAVPDAPEPEPEPAEPEPEPAEPEPAASSDDAASDDSSSSNHADSFAKVAGLSIASLALIL